MSEHKGFVCRAKHGEHQKDFTVWVSEGELEFGGNDAVIRTARLHWRRNLG
jgi:hypothetical protein